MTTGTVCGANSSIATSIVRIDNFPVSLAQGIALTYVFKQYILPFLCNYSVL